MRSKICSWSFQQMLISRFCLSCKRWAMISVASINRVGVAMAEVNAMRLSRPTEQNYCQPAVYETSAQTAVGHTCSYRDFEEALQPLLEAVDVRSVGDLSSVTFSTTVTQFQPRRCLSSNFVPSQFAQQMQTERKWQDCNALAPWRNHFAPRNNDQV